MKQQYSGIINIYTDELNNSHMVGSPTGNCQIFSIIYANQILHVNYTEAQQKASFKEHYTYSGHKNMMLIDVNTNLESRVEALFGSDYIVFKSPYISTNATKMTIYLIRTEVFKTW